MSLSPIGLPSKVKIRDVSMATNIYLISFPKNDMFSLQQNSHKDRESSNKKHRLKRKPGDDTSIGLQIPGED